MAAYLNRTISLVTGNGQKNGLDSNPFVDRQLHTGINDVTSPLQIFVKAKKKINDIFGDISDYVVETTNFIEGGLALEIGFF